MDELAVSTSQGIVASQQERWVKELEASYRVPDRARSTQYDFDAAPMLASSFVSAMPLRHYPV